MLHDKRKGPLVERHWCAAPRGHSLSWSWRALDNFLGKKLESLESLRSSSKSRQEPWLRAHAPDWSPICKRHRRTWKANHSTSDKSKMHQSLQSSWPLFLSNLSVSNERFPFSNAAASVKYPASSFICKRGSSTTHDTLLGCTSSASDACTHMLRTLGFIVHEELLSSLLCHGWACQGQRQRTLAAAAKPCPCHLPRQQGQQWLPSTSIATLALDITSPPHLTHLCYHHSELQALQHVQLAVFPTKGLARHRRHTQPYTSSLLCNTAFLGLAQPNSQQHHMEKRPAASSASFRPAAALERCTVHSVVKRS